MDGSGTYPTMKDSGVEWLGDVPAHWGCRRLKTLCSMQSGEAITAESIEATRRRYAEMMLRSEPLRGEFIRRSTGIRPSGLRLYPDSFLRVGLMVPPPEEQSAIVDFVARETARSDRACRLMTEEVSVLQEYRVRLVADVVTGKLDVRQAADLDERSVTCKVGVGRGRGRAGSNSSVRQGVATLEESL